MNRALYFNYIDEKLGFLSYRINLRGRLNILDFHNHSENFYCQFLKQLYNWDLENLNEKVQNVEGIDLVDHKNKVVLQVSATNTKAKLQSAISSEILKQFPSYRFKMILISKDGKALKALKLTDLSNPHNVAFDPKNDIIDNKSILQEISSCIIEKQKNIYEFIKKELGSEVDIVKLDSNLAVVINALSKEDLNLNSDIEINQFEITRKIAHNNLTITQSIIDDHAQYHSRLDKKYREFDMLGSNKSLSVLQTINQSYTEAAVKFSNESEDKIFLELLENVKGKLIQSANIELIPSEELQLCVNIVVVDAFIRCKIFKNPKDYKYVTA